MSAFDHQSGKHIKVGGAEIYYEEIGNPTAEPLFLLHGAFGNIEDFNELVPLLEKSYYLIGIDSCGHGKSSLGVKKLTYERLQHDVEAICAELKLKEISILGIGDGGVTAYRVACLSKLKVKKLITIGARWHYKNAEDTKKLLAGTTPKKYKSAFPDRYKKYQSLNPEPAFDKLTVALVTMWLDSNASGYPNEKAQKIKSKTLIARADSDECTTRKTVFDLAASIKGSHLLNIPLVGESNLLAQNSPVIHTIHEFLKQ